MADDEKVVINVDVDAGDAIAQLAALRAALKAVQDDQSKVAASSEKQAASARKLSQDSEKAATAIKSEDRSALSLAQSHKTASSAADLASRSTKKLTDEHKTAADALKKHKTAVEAFKKELGELGGALAKTGKIIGLAFGGLTAVLGGVKLAFIAAQGAVKLWNGAITAAAGAVGVLVAALGTLLAAQRQVQVAQLVPTFKLAGASGPINGPNTQVNNILGNPNFAQFKPEALISGLQELSGAGVATDQTMRNLFTTLGNFAAGAPGAPSANFQKIASAVAAMRQEGKVTAQTFTQLQNASPALAQAFGEFVGGKAGNPANLLQAGTKAAAAGKTSVDAFLNAVDSGQLKTAQAFEGQLARINNTLIGRFKMAVSQIKQQLVEIGQPFLNLFQAPLKGFQQDIQIFLTRITPQIRNVFPKLIGTGGGGLAEISDTVFTKLAQLVDNGLPKLIGFGHRFGEVFRGVRQWFRDVAPWLKTLADGFDAIFNSLLKPVGVQLLKSIGDILQSFAKYAKAGQANFADFGKEVADLIKHLGNLVKMALALQGAFTPVLTELLKIFNAIGKAIEFIDDKTHGGGAIAIAAIGVGLLAKKFSELSRAAYAAAAGITKTAVATEEVAAAGTTGGRFSSAATGIGGFFGRTRSRISSAREGYSAAEGGGLRGGLGGFFGGGGGGGGASAATFLAPLAAQLVLAQVAPNISKRSVSGQALIGAGQGAATGALLGSFAGAPGALVGGVAGGLIGEISGVFGARDAQRKEREAAVSAALKGTVGKYDTNSYAANRQQLATSTNAFRTLSADALTAASLHNQIKDLNPVTDAAKIQKLNNELHHLTSGGDLDKLNNAIKGMGEGFKKLGDAGIILKGNTESAGLAIGKSAKELDEWATKAGVDLSKVTIGVNTMINGILGYGTNQVTNRALAAGRLEEALNAPIKAQRAATQTHAQYTSTYNAFLQAGNVSKDQAQSNAQDVVEARNAYDAAQFAAGKFTSARALFADRRRANAQIVRDEAKYGTSAVGIKAFNQANNASESQFLQQLRPENLASIDPTAALALQNRVQLAARKIPGSILTAAAQGNTKDLEAYLKGAGKRIGADLADTFGVKGKGETDKFATSMSKLLGQTLVEDSKTGAGALSTAITDALKAGGDALAHKIVDATNGIVPSPTLSTVPFAARPTPKSTGKNTGRSDTYSSRFGRTLSAHRRLTSGLPGSRSISSGMRNFALGSPNSDHLTGGAIDITGDYLGSYAQLVRAGGGFAEFHGDGGGRHLHVVPAGDTMAPVTPGTRVGDVYSDSYTFHIEGGTDNAETIANVVLRKLQTKHRSDRERS